MKTNLHAFLFLLAMSTFLHVHAQDDAIPRLSGKSLVYDFADMLSENEEQALNRKLIAYNDSTSNEFVIVTVADLKGYDVGDFAQRLADKNGIGKAGKDNGALILISRDDRKISIQVGYGLEPVIPDGKAGFIIRNIITPAFKEKKYYEGLDRATDAMMEMAAGEFDAEKYKKDEPWYVPVLFLTGIFFLLFFFSSRKKNKYSTYSGKGRHSGAWPFWGGGFGGGGFGGGGSGGGGGFGGFGGGGFGGGGASGGW